jgi:hypothetical protein
LSKNESRGALAAKPVPDFAGAQSGLRSPIKYRGTKVVTPFELSLRNELEVEWQRFDGEWLFKWHGMTYEGGVTDVDDFRGGRIRYGGILFGDQQQQIFWEALSRYLNQKVHDVFKQWDVETRGYPAPVRLRSIEGLELILTGFAQQIVGRAVDTDRRLRGGGYPESVRPYNSGGSVRAIAEISRLAAAHRSTRSYSARRLCQ